jgi:hypothetical protein
VMIWNWLNWLSVRFSGGLLCHVNETSTFIKRRESFNYLSNYKFLSKVSPPRSCLVKEENSMHNLPTIRTVCFWTNCEDLK